MFKINDTTAIADPAELTLVDKLLAEQKQLTAVERFSQKHENATSPLQEPHYKDLIPIRKPSTGEQYSFAVDLDKCTGCKACVVACHSLNGLDANESWRDVGTIRSISSEDQQTVTSACHHCADPGCLSGCPVGAYEKMPETGIVRHLDDQCIGCEYCSLKCPYDVPKYNKDLGIVRKCDMCHERLEEGEAPACVQSCPNGAISIQLISTEKIREKAREQESIIAGAFRSDYTYPSTTYTSQRTLADDMIAADEHSLEPSHKHTPLSWMLMLTQVAVGISVADFILRLVAIEWSENLHIPMLALSIVLGMIGLGASLLHLGSPLGAWRVFLGLKTSWLSREVILFGKWMPALILYGVLTGVEKYKPAWLEIVPVESTLLLNVAGIVAVSLGLLSVFCSIMVYADTKRAFWSFEKTSLRFIGTSLLGGMLSLFVVSSMFKEEIPVAILFGAATALLFKIGVELLSLLPAKKNEWSYAKRSALIQLHSLRKTLFGRAFFLLILVACLVASIWIPIFGIVALLSLLVGEWLERQLYFQAVVTLKMPGSVRK